MRALPFVLIATLAIPAWAGAQDRQRVPPSEGSTSGSSSSGGGNSSGGTAVPRESPPPPPPPAPAAPPASSPAAAAPRSSTPAAADEAQSQRRQRVPPEARGGQQPAQPQGGTAVARPAGQPPRVNNNGTYQRGDGRPYSSYNYYYYPRRYYPYGYGAFGLGYFYYDPYSWGSAYGYPAYAPFRGYGYGYPTGEIRLDVSPREAEVYVDGYYAGRVDDFDGAFQSLELEEGTYHIEVVAPGYGTLGFDVRIFPGRKITYRGDLLRVTP